MYIPGAQRDHKRVPGPLEWRTIVSQHMGAGKNLSLVEEQPATAVSQQQSHSFLQPLPFFFKWIIPDGILLISATIIPHDYVFKPVIA